MGNPALNLMLRPRLENPEQDSMATILAAQSGLGMGASVGGVFDKASFGRDTEWTVKATMRLHPELALRLLVILGSHMSLSTNKQADLVPGKIMHELRQDLVDGRLVSPQSLAIIAELGPRWGGTTRGFKTGFAADSTAIWINDLYDLYLLFGDRYREIYGHDLLEMTIQHVEGQTFQLHQLVSMAADCEAREVSIAIDEDGVALKGWERQNKAHGHVYQILEDGAEYLSDASGNLANANRRLYATGLQGYTYDALSNASSMLEGFSQYHLQVQHWRSLADHLQHDTLRLAWIPDQRYFAAGFHHPSNGDPLERLDLLTDISPLLASTIFDNLSPAEQDGFINPSFEMLCSEEFWSPAGVLGKARRHAHLLEYADYHGAKAAWGIKQLIFLMASLKHGVAPLGKSAAYSHLLHLQVTGFWKEALYVTLDDEVLHFPQEWHEGDPRDRVFVAADMYQSEQTWTAAMAYFLLTLDQHPELELNSTRPLRDRPELVESISQSLRLRTKPPTKEEIAGIADSSPIWYIDQQKGAQLRQQLLAPYGY